MIAERTGRTLQELVHGGPNTDPMSAAEYIQWVALITVVEPAERAEAQQEAKSNQGSSF